MAAENVTVTSCGAAARAVSILRFLAAHGIAAESISLILIEKQMTAAHVADPMESGSLQSVAGDAGCASFGVALTGCTIFVAPNKPTLLVAGPLGRCLSRTLQNGALFGDLGAIAGALYSLGMPRDAARAYESAAFEGNALIVVQGRARDVTRVRRLLTEVS